MIESQGINVRTCLSLSLPTTKINKLFGGGNLLENLD